MGSIITLRILKIYLYDFDSLSSHGKHTPAAKKRYQYVIFQFMLSHGEHLNIVSIRIFKLVSIHAPRVGSMVALGEG